MNQLYLYGYTGDETGIKIPPIVDCSINVFRNRKNENPVSSSLGCHVSRVAPFKPSLDHTTTAVQGVLKRVAHAMPDRDDLIRSNFRDFVRQWVSQNLSPIEPTADLSVDNWLANTNYTFSRKEQLRKIDLTRPVTKRDFANKCFVKDEFYPELKHSRGIYSRSDRYKVEVGPIFKLMEKKLFSLNYFIKKVPVLDRPKKIYEIFSPGSKYVATDFSTFEAHFTSEVMNDCEMYLYRYLTQNILTDEQFDHKIRTPMTGINKLKFHDFSVKLRGKRMSGEMCTSLGNSFFNLMCMLFACKQTGSSVNGFVEGDDGIFCIKGEIPSVEFFTKMGCEIKLEIFEELNMASFCGLIFDTESFTNITNPIDVLVEFGWSSRKYVPANNTRRKELLKAKSMSMAYQYAGCPIIQELALYGMRATANISLTRYLTKNVMSMWDREKLLEALSHPVCEKKVQMSTRMLMQAKFGISLESQLQIEEYLSTLNDLQPLQHEAIYRIIPDRYVVHYSRYVSDAILTHYDSYLRPEVIYPDNIKRDIRECFYSSRNQHVT